MTYVYTYTPYTVNQIIKVIIHIEMIGIRSCLLIVQEKVTLTLTLTLTVTLTNS